MDSGITTKEIKHRAQVLDCPAFGMICYFTGRFASMRLCTQKNEMIKIHRKRHYDHRLLAILLSILNYKIKF